MLAQDGFRAEAFDIGLAGVNLCICIAMEMVDRHHGRHAEPLDVFNVPAKIGATIPDCRHILSAQISFGHAAIHLHGADRGDNDNR